MSNPLQYFEQPHAKDRAHRVKQVIGYTLGAGNDSLIHSLQNGSDSNFTFGVLFDDPSGDGYVASPDHLAYEGSQNIAARRIIISGGNWLTHLTISNYQQLIVPVSQLALAANTVQ